MKTSTALLKTQSEREEQSLEKLWPRQPVDVYDIIVFSHSRWEFVSQRPQQLLTRFARDRKVLYVEDPIQHEPGERGGARTIQVSDRLTVLQPCIDPEDKVRQLGPVLADHAARIGLRSPVLWFYSPTFVDILDYIGDASLIVYDCVDELSLFRGAPDNIVSDERRLLAAADLVFTAGRSLYEATSRLHDDVHCFPSSVDRAHFTPAHRAPQPTDIAGIPHPIVGYSGDIDERIDLALLAYLAEHMPSTSFVLIGPVVKIAEDELPRARNLHYLGRKSYAELPAYLRAFDITMLPFALNEATLFVNPTETLEFMAAKKPIVSTPITDIVREYKREVAVGATPKDFMQHLVGYERETKIKRAYRETLMEAALAKVSWDKTVAAMMSLIYAKLKPSEPPAIEPNLVFERSNDFEPSQNI